MPGFSHRAQAAHAYRNVASPSLFFHLDRPYLKSSPKKLFVHYFGPYPRSFDNINPFSSDDYYDKNYITITPASEPQHVAYGGLLRDRPLERTPLSGDYVLQDCTWDILAAQSMGIDGFFVNIMGISGANWDRYKKLMDAAVALGGSFKVIPMIDANGSAAQGSTTPAQWSTALGYFIGKNASYYLPNGKYMLASFRAEGKTTTWWTNIMNQLNADYGVNVSFMSIFVNTSSSNVSTYASISDYTGAWSVGADPGVLSSTSAQAAQARSLGVDWAGAALTQNIRPSGGGYDEAGNSEALRESWDRIGREAAELVQIVTWSDFSEGSQIVPSVGRGWGPLAITAYHMVKWKTGRYPKITRDCLILSHRDQPLTGATYQSGQTKFMSQYTDKANHISPRDKVEALTYLTASASVSINVGGTIHNYTAPAGEYVQLFNNALGTISGTVTRSGQTVASVTSPFTVTNNPISQDRQYFFVSSLHGVSGQHPVMLL